MYYYHVYIMLHFFLLILQTKFCLLNILHSAQYAALISAYILTMT